MFIFLLEVVIRICVQLEKVKALMKRNSAGSAGVTETANSLSSSKFANKLAKKRRNNPKVKIRQFIDSGPISALINICILWALFSEDIRVMAMPKTADYPVWSIHVVVMFIFLLEVVIRICVQRGYFNCGFGFYFWLDFIASVTMFFDWLPMTESNEISSSGQQALRAAKSARVGTRIARIVRVVRIIRMIRLLLSSQKKKQKGDEDEQPEDEGTPSELSKALQGAITKRTIAFILLLLGGQVILEFFDYANISGTFPAEPPFDRRVEMGMAQLFGVVNASNFSVYSDDWIQASGSFINLIEAPLRTTSLWSHVFLSVFKIELKEVGAVRANYTFWPVPLKGPGEYYKGHSPAGFSSSYPADDLMSSWVPTWPSPDSHWDNCDYTDLNSLSAYAGVDQKNCPDAHGIRRSMRSLRIVGPKELLVEPLFKDGVERIVLWYSRKEGEDVQAGFSVILIMSIAILLVVMGFLLSRDIDALVVRPIETMVDSVTKLAANPAYQLEKIEVVRYETDALKLSLSKIATMLQVGFGEAGNDLVAENLKRGDTVDPMVPGRKLLGAYGFCIIDEYEEVLECLGEEILPFTNTAADIVHAAVTENGGQPNRNLGEAFLCVWKPQYPAGKVHQLGETGDPEVKAAETKMCDGALTAFRRCVRGIAQSYKLQAYNKHEEIMKFFDGHYSTRIGYGLHYGWAIEGAVGTNIKIDCSYLSPNVNLAARLESATKMYGVNILMSESFFSKLSPAMQKGLRRVDVVCLKGSSIPMAIYTCDRSNGLYVAPEAIKRHGEENVIGEFQRVFEEGMDAFVAGDWTTSKGHFESALAICPRDKPSNRIIMHMDTPENHPDYGLATTPFVAPDGWPGYHILLSK